MAQPPPSPASTEDFTCWFELSALDRKEQTASQLVAPFKQCLSDAHDQLAERFTQGSDVALLLQARSWLIDQILRHCWSCSMGKDAESLALVAVGGYGRSELMPGSDIDLMLLLPDVDDPRINSQAETLLTFLWDVGLDVGHSVRTVADCVEQSLADITVVTNLMESRLLAGSISLYETMLAATAPDKIWHSRDFFETKLAEQHTRHHKFHDSGYNLEPNIKEGPGGLRDIQMITWVTKRHFGTASLEELVERDFLTHAEYQTLIAGRNLLWNLRFALHTLTGRSEDRLQFDYQRTLAEQFGYRNDDRRLGVEAFMREYYRTIMDLSRLNEMLLQLFNEEILYPEGLGEPVSLNKRFQSRNGYLETVDDRVFNHYPMALLEMFLVMAQHPELKGVRADTIRAIRTERDRIDHAFRKDIRVRSLFMELMRQPHGITHALRRMNAYGVLAAYLPAFGNIVGLMQYDLVHMYTVDEHILMVVRNLRRFTVHEFANEYPLCSHIIGTLPKPELLYIAGLFHDIAKGRGGDHSKLGSTDAFRFCEMHDLGEYDTRLVTWLVKQHLLMSSTAQSLDIDDPVVVNRFASIVEDTIRLDYLYLLTVADIRGTNPELWNHWKDSLLKQLYYNTRRALHRGLQDPIQRSEQIEQAKAAALVDLADSVDSYEPLWQRLGDEYFLHHMPSQIAAHTRLLARHDANNGYLVSVDPDSERGGTEIFIYGKSRERLFSLITSVIEQLGLTVVDAGVVTTDDDHILDTFHVLEENGQPVTRDTRLGEIQGTLKQSVDSDVDSGWHVSRRLPRQHKHFPIKTHIAFRQDMDNQRTIMELITADRPGLLSRIGRAFADCDVRLWNAKIATLGTRAEDFYYITDMDNQPLTREEQFVCLEQAVEKYLD